MKKTQTSLKKSLLYLHVEELREIARKVALSDKGNKISLIHRIIHFLETGEKKDDPIFPEVSCVKKGKAPPLSEEGLMLKGAYKNDLKTRLFFKKIIGPHFHFTAFGIDWLNQRWLDGNPPTYSEFARMWEEEYKRRETMPAQPKEEWAYIRFVKQELSKHPQATKKELLESWQKERLIHKKAALESIKAHLHNQK